MEFIWNNGIDITLMAQSAGSWLAQPMQIASLLGTEAFYLLFLFIIYWCIDSSAGRLLGCMLLLSDSVNTFFKLLLQHPRPYWYSSDVTAYGIENSFGAPSGHSQHVVSMWGTLAVIYHSWKLKAAAAVIILLVSFSRVYLGVHFYTDVLLGWAIGFILIFLLTKVFDSAGKKLAGMNLRSQLIIAFFSSAAVMALQLIPLLINSGWVFPEAWKQNIAAALPGSETPDPLKIKNIISVSGAVLGYGAGLALIHKNGGFNADGTLKQRCLRFAAGLAVAALIYAGLKAVLPHGQSPAAEFCRYIRYALTGLWIAWGAPYMFIRLGLARKER